MNQRRKRTPKGVFDTKPIALRLMPEEREEADIMAKQAGKTRAAFARETYLAGLALIRSKNSVASSSSADSPGSAVQATGRTALSTQGQV